MVSDWRTAQLAFAALFKTVIALGFLLTGYPFFFFFFAFSVMAGLFVEYLHVSFSLPVPLSVELYGPHFVHADSHYLPTCYRVKC